MKYTEVEDSVIIEVVNEFGGKLSNKAVEEIMKRLYFRSESSIKERWYAHLRPAQLQVKKNVIEVGKRKNFIVRFVEKLFKRK